MEEQPRTFLVWGAGGHGRVVAELAEAMGHRVVGFIDRDEDRLADLSKKLRLPASHLEAEFLDYLETYERYPEGVDACALGIGNNHDRLKSLERLEGYEAPILVHPTASISVTAVLGSASVVLPQSVIHTGAHLHGGVIVNTGSIVEHDCILHTATHVAPGAVLCGGVRVGECGWIGAGATVVQNIVIGKDATVGGGSTVVRDVPDGATVVGSPARAIRTRPRD